MTAPASLDARNQIPERLRRLGMSARFFSELCEISQRDFLRMLSGEKTLTGPQTLEFSRVLGLCEEFVRLLEPMPWIWSDPNATREFLRSPRFPSLFLVFSDAQLLQLDRINRLDADNERMEREIEESGLRTRDLFLSWLQEFEDAPDEGS